MTKLLVGYHYGVTFLVDDEGVLIASLKYQRNEEVLVEKGKDPNKKDLRIVLWWHRLENGVKTIQPQKQQVLKVVN